MTKFWNTAVRQWQDSANFVLGIWLIVSPWVLGYATETYSARNAWAVGVIIAVAAIS
ncbi:MAG TPA: SPW repeat protein, partial [Alphaproteobacteria bacterium]